MIENPHLPEVRYSLDLMMLQLHLLRPRPACVRIATASVELAKAVARRLEVDGGTLIVENEEIRQALNTSFSLTPRLLAEWDAPVEVVLCPFSIESGIRLLEAKTVIAASRNACSYKKLLQPGFAGRRITTMFASLAKSYEVVPVAGLFAPPFIVRWTLAKAVERFHSPLYFRLEDWAMLSLVDFSGWWRYAYIVVYTARHK